MSVQFKNTANRNRLNASGPVNVKNSRTQLHSVMVRESESNEECLVSGPVSLGRSVSGAAADSEVAAASTWPLRRAPR